MKNFFRRESTASDALYEPAQRMPLLKGSVPPVVRLLSLVTVLSFAMALLPGAFGSFFTSFRWVSLVGLLLTAAFFSYRLMQGGLLWRLRNKLALTYLLIGLAPLLLFFTLVFLFSYVAAGQFAIHLATSHFREQLIDLDRDNGDTTGHVLRILEERRFDKPVMELPEVEARVANSHAGLLVSVYQDSVVLPVRGVTDTKRSGLLLPLWLKGKEPHFRGIVVEDDVLYLASLHQATTSNGHTLTVILATPLNRTNLDDAADGLGRLDLLPGVERDLRSAKANAKQTRAFSGGSAFPAANALDYKVRFLAALPVISWDSGEDIPVTLMVQSRPSALYEQLFGTPLTGRISDTVRTAFFAVCIVFAFLEAFALYMALRLSRTITESVEDLYAATISVDRGDLQHRILVRRNDQLADLSRSFNRMSWSLGRLIEQQKEKERIESELSIAQEVQANLFPRQEIQLPTLELHGVCRPARTVSGDYYDFLPVERMVVGADGREVPEITGLGIAMGDISGKGISAALLMATLHSAVRAYQFASEELLTPASLSFTQGESAECSAIFASPGKLLSLLNRHLYRSTTPEKYATLFLAHYEQASSQLTYANGGQLPPFILRHCGELKRLDCGGTVVGLLDGMEYGEETVPMEPGDILICYSDGVTEPENDFGDFGDDRLIDVVREFRDQPLEVISTEVMRALNAWIGEGEQPDDITLVLARQR